VHIFSKGVETFNHQADDVELTVKTTLDLWSNPPSTVRVDTPRPQLMPNMVLHMHWWLGNLWCCWWCPGKQPGLVRGFWGELESGCFKKNTMKFMNSVGQRNKTGILFGGFFRVLFGWLAGMESKAIE